MTDHLALWNVLCATDPKYTKRFTRSGGFSGTAINGTYVVRKLTQAFGPCGRGWRFVIEDERIEDGHTLGSGDKARVHIIRGHLAYMLDDVWYETSPQFGQTTFVGENKNGVFTDEEAPKKSITDCISKCAVLLGIAADVHLGQFDDNKYVSDRMAEEAKNGPSPSKSFHGPLGITELKKKMRAFAGDLEGCDDETQLIVLLNDKAVMALHDQCQRDLPSWWYGEGDSKGAQGAIDQKRTELAQKAVQGVEPIPGFDTPMAG